MKRKLFITIAFTLFSFIAYPQEEVFVYSRANGIIRLTSSSDTIFLHDYVHTKNRTRDRNVKFGSETYTFSTSKTRDRIQTIRDGAGVVRATVPLGPNNRYDIILPDGPVLECAAMGRSSTGLALLRQATMNNNTQDF